MCLSVCVFVFILGSITNQRSFTSLLGGVLGSGFWALLAHQGLPSGPSPCDQGAGFAGGIKASGSVWALLSRVPSLAWPGGTVRSICTFWSGPCRACLDQETCSSPGTLSQQAPLEKSESLTECRRRVLLGWGCVWGHLWGHWCVSECCWLFAGCF